MVRRAEAKGGVRREGPMRVQKRERERERERERREGRREGEMDRENNK